jgi:hypothetical protein
MKRCHPFLSPSLAVLFAGGLLCLSAVQAADVPADVLTVNTNAIINGVDPGLGANKTTIGGGVIRTIGDINSNRSLSAGTATAGGNLFQNAQLGWLDVLVVNRAGTNVWSLQDNGAGTGARLTTGLQIAGILRLNGTISQAINHGTYIANGTNWAKQTVLASAYDSALGALTDRVRLVVPSATSADAELSVNVLGVMALRVNGSNVMTVSGSGGISCSSTIIGTDPNPSGSELLRVGGASKFSGSTTADRFSNVGFVGTNESNARNHFTQTRGGNITPLTGGWISAAFGDTNGSRVVVGQGEGVAIIAGHSGNLDTWADLYVSGSLTNQGDGVTYIKGRAPTSVPVNTVAIGGGRVMVGGTLSAKEIKVTTTGADYVFENDYKLRPLAEVESFIAKHKHLPEMMSAKAMQADGMPVSDVVTKQLAKIEELTLYAIQAQKDRDTALARADAVQAVAKATQDQVAAQEARMSAQETRIQRLENLIRNLSPAVVP